MSQDVKEIRYRYAKLNKYMPVNDFCSFTATVLCCAGKVTTVGAGRDTRSSLVRWASVSSTAAPEIFLLYQVCGQLFLHSLINFDADKTSFATFNDSFSVGKEPLLSTRQYRTRYQCDLENLKCQQA